MNRQSEDVFWLPAIAQLNREMDLNSGLSEMVFESRVLFRSRTWRPIAMVDVAGHRMECGWVHVTGPRGLILVPAGTDLFLAGWCRYRNHAPIYQNAATRPRIMA